jgi:catechol 2,3-dioxygenase-like lactoylglutathione lyase family enzyme
MLTAFDHLIVAVRDLSAASQAYRRLGFDVRPGGRNPGNGTHNAIIRFGVDYIELLSIEDVALALERAPRGRELQAYLEARTGGAVGYVAQSDDIAEDVDRAARAGFADIGRPIEMRRARPDGRELSWHLLIPGDRAFRQPWPLLIQWHTADAERLAIEPPGRHENGALGLRELALAVRDLPAAMALYHDQLGLPVDRAGRSAALAASEARTRLGAVVVRLLAPDRDGPIAREIRDHGEGPFRVGLAVADLEATRSLLRSRGVALTEAGGEEIDVDPAESIGVRIRFSSATTWEAP